MIRKEKIESDRTNVEIIDKNGNSFLMHFAGNMDLYWIPTDYKNVLTFYFDKSDEILYSLFDQLFEAIKKQENEIFKPSIENDEFTFISEDCHEDDAHRLKIKKEEQFVVNFVRNESYAVSHFPKRGCNICFCNSGSRVPKVEILFQKLYLYLVMNNFENEIENLKN